MRTGVKMNSPAESDCVSWDTFVSMLSSDTLAPTTTAPLASLTAPKIVPASCARTVVTDSNASKTPGFMMRIIAQAWKNADYLASRRESRIQRHAAIHKNACAGDIVRQV